MSPRNQSKGGIALRAGYYTAVVVAAVCLVVSMLSWSLPLAAISLALAVLLFRNLDVVVETSERRAQ